MGRDSKNDAQEQRASWMLQLVLDTIPVRVFWKDRESRFLGCNRLFAQDAGLERAEELIGRTDYEMGWRDQAELYRADDRQVMESGTPRLNYEEPQTTPDGRTIWLRTSKIPLCNEAKEIVGVLGTYEDITERKKAEEALRLAEFSIEHNAMPTFLVGPDGRILRANGAATEMLGYSQEELLTMRVQEIDRTVEPGTWDDIWVGMRGVGGASFESVHTRKDGSTVPVGVSNSFFEFEGREYVASFVRDLTERKQAEEARRGLEAQVQHVQKLESLGVLAGGIAHDFNNLLVGILGNAELALGHISAGSPAHELLEKVQKAALTAAELTAQLLAYSGKGRFVLEVVNLSAFVHEMTPLLETSVTKRARLEWDLPTSLPNIKVDASQLRQVIMNLATNASDAVRESGGVITIRTGETRMTPEHLRASVAENVVGEHFVFVEVTDDGVGMKGKVIPQIFEPFFTTKFSGRGLGLASVLGIVRSHGGALFVDSEPGEGTTFRVLFPVSHDSVVESAATAAAPRLSGGGRVLLVDDEEVARQVARVALSQAGYDVLEAGDGREALDILDQCGDEIDAVVLDLTMPKLGGDQVLLELRKTHPTLPVLLTSGYALDATTKALGFSEFLQKPFGPAALLAKLAAAMARGG